MRQCKRLLTWVRGRSLRTSWANTWTPRGTRFFRMGLGLSVRCRRIVFYFRVSLDFYVAVLDESMDGKCVHKRRLFENGCFWWCCGFSVVLDFEKFMLWSCFGYCDNKYCDFVGCDERLILLEHLHVFCWTPSKMDLFGYGSRLISLFSIYFHYLITF